MPEGSALLVEDAVTNMSSPRRPALIARQFALAVALAAGTAVLAVPGFTDAAYAQKKKKKGEEEAEAGKPVYTPAFVKAYQPLDAKLKVPGVDVAALKAEITSAVALTDEERTEIEKKLVESFGSNLEFSYQVDPDILGGLIVQVGDKLIDDSVRGRLNALRQKIGI